MECDAHPPGPFIKIDGTNTHRYKLVRRGTKVITKSHTHIRLNYTTYEKFKYSVRS